ncbi:MAG: hypothetical protein JJT88_12995 [Gammaproteobacteria bacterium]|nr:hypothetical protein [Gammaproteobacteria bacterium]
MVLRGTLRLKPSRWARRALAFGVPAILLILLYAAWSAGSIRPLIVLPAVFGVALLAALSWDRVRGLQVRSGSLLLDLGDGHWQPVVPIGSARISALAVTLACRREGDGRRLRLNIWRDAVDATTYRRLARMARHGRWPVAASEDLTATRTASPGSR